MTEQTNEQRARVVPAREATGRAGPHTRSAPGEAAVRSRGGPRDRALVVGSSPAFLKVIWEVFLVAGHQVSVLIEGESGTGKELISRAIHDLSGRRDGPFVAVNCGALPRELLESELFGSARGAFTGAVRDREGLVTRADGGTLFLDELPSMDLELQSKLLRFLDSGELRRVGDGEARFADVRIVAASNVDLATEVAEGRFRQDLFFRLSTFPLRLPPLRDRREDIPVLAEHFLASESRRLGVEAPRLAASAVEALKRHAWPGNVRELQNLVTRLVLRSAGRAVRAADLADLADRGLGGGAAECAGGTPLWRQGTFQNLKAEVVGRFERNYLVSLLRDHAGNVSRAARAAGKHRRALTELLNKHGIDPGEFRS